MDMLEDYLKLLQAYQALPSTKQRTSIFDISGYPHYENVCSNVLAFFLDPEKEHGLGDLILSSLLKLAQHPQEQSIGAASIEREFSTNAGGRLDILIRTDGFVIGIENKIFHHLNNDLDDYQSTLKSQSKDSLTIVGVVLSLHPVAPAESSSFINILYGELWAEVEAGLGIYAAEASLKWMAYLLDFIHTTKSLAGKSMELNETDLFLIENVDALERLVQAHKGLREKLVDQLKKLMAMISESGELPAGIKKEPWIWSRTTLVHDYQLSGRDVGFDLTISTQGWEWVVFERGPRVSEYVALLLKPLGPLPTLNKENRFILAQWPLATDLETIRSFMCAKMNWIVVADAAHRMHLQ